MTDRVRRTELIELPAAGNAESCLQRSRRIVESGVDHLAIAGAGFGAESALPFENNRLESSPCQRPCAGKADHAGTDHDRLDALHCAFSR